MEKENGKCTYYRKKNTQKIPPVTVKLFYIISQDYC